MGKAKEQNFLQGALILGMATVIVKVIGVFFKIPLTNLLGGTGMAYFFTAYDLFNPLYTLAMAGFPVAVSKIVSENYAKWRFRDVRKVLRLSMFLFLATGIIGTAAMAVGARAFAYGVNNPKAFLPVLVMAPAIFFGCLMSAFRGYYQGLRNMYPTAVSQVVEAIAKLVFGIAFAYSIMGKGLEEFAVSGTVFGQIAANLEAAKELLLPFGAAGAVAGVTLSTAVGCIFLILRHKLIGDGIVSEQLQASPQPVSSKKLFITLASIAFPIVLSSVVGHMTTLIDLGSIMNRLETAINADTPAFLRMYQGILPEAMKLSEIPVFLYGSYTGLAVSVFNLVPAVSTTIGVSALPAVASAWAVRNRSGVKRSIEGVLRVTCFMVLPAGLGISALAKPILNLLFSARPIEVAIAAPALEIMGIGSILVAITTPVNSMLQAVGKITLPVKLMLIGCAIKLATNYVLVSQPEINIQGAPYGTILCYGFIVIASLIALVRSSGVDLDYMGVFIKPLFAAGICAMSAKLSFSLLSAISDSGLWTILAIAIGGIFYLFTLFLTKTIKKDDILMLPGGEKMANILEKHFVLR